MELSCSWTLILFRWAPPAPSTRSNRVICKYGKQLPWYSPVTVHPWAIFTKKTSACLFCIVTQLRCAWCTRYTLYCRVGHKGEARVSHQKWSDGKQEAAYPIPTISLFSMPPCPQKCIGWQAGASQPCRPLACAVTHGLPRALARSPLTRAFLACL